MKYLNEVYLALSAIATAITGLVGGWDNAISVFVVFIVLDILTGVMKGVMEGNFTSKRLRKGFMSKAGYLVVLIIATQLDKLLPDDGAIPVIRTLCIYFYVFVEGSSIIENLAQMGVPIPKVLRDKLAVLQSKTGEDEKENKNP